MLRQAKLIKFLNYLICQLLEHLQKGRNAQKLK